VNKELRRIPLPNTPKRLQSRRVLKRKVTRVRHHPLRPDRAHRPRAHESGVLSQSARCQPSYSARKPRSPRCAQTSLFVPEAPRRRSRIASTLFYRGASNGAVGDAKHDGSRAAPESRTEQRPVDHTEAARLCPPLQANGIRFAKPLDPRGFDDGRTVTSNRTRITSRCCSTVIASHRSSTPSPARSAMFGGTAAARARRAAHTSPLYRSGERTVPLTFRSSLYRSRLYSIAVAGQLGAVLLEGSFKVRRGDVGHRDSSFRWRQGGQSGAGSTIWT
jgi:hypothetical protein